MNLFMPKKEDDLDGNLNFFIFIEKEFVVRNF
jgi:hypothetical protein